MPSSHPTVMAYFRLLEASESSASASSLLRSGQKNPLTENTPAEPGRARGRQGCPNTDAFKTRRRHDATAAPLLLVAGLLLGAASGLARVCACVRRRDQA